GQARGPAPPDGAAAGTASLRDDPRLGPDSPGGNAADRPQRLRDAGARPVAAARHAAAPLLLLADGRFGPLPPPGDAAGEAPPPPSRGCRGSGSTPAGPTTSRTWPPLKVVPWLS